MKKILLIGILFVAGLVCAKAQDVIVKANGDRVFAKILEVGDDVVKYKDYNNQNGPDYTIKTSDFEKITLANGDVIKGNPKTSGIGSGGPIPEPIAYKKGFLSAGIGYSTLLESDYTNIKGGYEIDLLFGYLFGKSVGIAAGGLFNSHSLKEGDGSFGSLGFYAGPLFSFSVSADRSLEILLIPTIGLSKGRIKIESVSELAEKFAFTAGAEAYIKWNFNPQWALMGGLGFRQMQKYDLGSIELDLSNFKIGAGISLRF